VLALHKGYYCWPVAIILCLSAYALAGQPQSKGLPPVEKLAADLINAKTQQARFALLAARKELVTPELRKALVTQGNLFLLKRRYAQALDTYNLSKSISEQMGDKFGTAESLHYIGVTYYAQGDDTRALDYHQKALRLFEELGDKLETGRTLVSIALALKDQGATAETLTLLQRALTYFEVLGTKEEMVGVLNDLGSIYLAQGQSSLALQSFQKSLALDPEAKNLFSVGSTFFFQGDYEQSVVYYQKALAHFEKQRNQIGIRDVLANLANAYYKQGNYDLALEYYQKLLAIQEKFGSESEISGTLLDIGEINFSRGNLSLALASYQRSLKLAENSGNKVAAALRLANIALIRHLQGGSEEALGHYRTSLSLLEGSDTPALSARVWASIANIYQGQSKYDAALAAYQHSLALREAMADKAGAARVLLDVGMVHVAKGEYAQALEVDQKALAQFESLGSKADVARAMTNIAVVEQVQGNYEQALNFSKGAIALSEKTASLEVLWSAHLQAGRIYQGLRQPVQARQEFKEAIATVEAMRIRTSGGGEGFAGNNSYPYLGMVESLIDDGKAGEALYYAERTKAQTLWTVLNKARITKTMTLGEQKEEFKVTDNLSSLAAQIDRENENGEPNTSRVAVMNSQLQKARRTYETFHEKLYAAHPQLKVLRGETSLLRPDDASPLFSDPKSALIEFVVTENKTYLFVLIPEETRGRQNSSSTSGAGSAALKVYTLPITSRELAERVDRFRQQITLKDMSFRQSARELYDLLLKPAEDKLIGRRSIVIVPDRELWGLPFQALQPAENHYLIEDRAISYAPSLSALGEMMKLGNLRMKTPAARSTLLALGNSLPNERIVSLLELTYRDEKISALSQVEKEVQSLRKVYGQDSSVLIDAEASEILAKKEANRYDILHFAAHAILDDVSPMFSLVALSETPGEREDGLWQAWEVMGLNLRTELVVLSASSIARGRAGTGNSVIGTTWSWFVAGSPTVVLSLWDVDSSSTTELMTAFHQKLRSRRRSSNPQDSKAEALRQATLGLLASRDYQHPYYWSGFVMVGDGR
jgi:CHAT domain-containing protein/Tfp pilus assembly protein PilF